MLRTIRWYQQQRAGVLSPCRFFPSCSEYADEAIRLHGPWRGGWMTVRRLLRCRPFGPSGFDPVPEVVHPSTLHRHTAACGHAHETSNGNV
ncbi:MAG: membrane protein insertion efficiency factor YidD [Actinomycetota bacterium]